MAGVPRFNPRMPSFGSPAVKVKIKISMPSFNGQGRKYTLNASGASKFAEALSKAEMKEARKYLRGAAAYCRTIMRRSFKKGKVTKAPRVFGRGTHNVRSRSKPPRPPHYHTKGAQWGMRTIIFTKLNKDQYAIGPKIFKSKGSKNSSFHIPEMLEFGGSGKVKTLAANQSVLNKFVTSKSSKYPTKWSSARYTARPYASITVKPTLKKFNKLYGR